MLLFLLSALPCTHLQHWELAADIHLLYEQQTTACCALQASGNGYHTVTLKNGIRDVYYARYLDWLVTTPLLLVDVLLICKLPMSSWFFAIFADVAMCLTGMFGGVLTGSYRCVLPTNRHAVPWVTSP